jgi:hypothetical protein
VAEISDKETQGQPEAALQGVASPAPAVMIALAAVAVIGAATANALPNFKGFSWPSFNRLSLPNFDGFSWPDLNRFVPQSPHETASVPIPDPAVSAALKDIQQSQQQNAVVLVSLSQNSATQQTDLKRISRQLSALAVQVDTLQSAVSAIPPLTTSSIPHSNPRARIVRTSRKIDPPLPPPVGPVSVGGAPLSPAPAPAPRSGA